MFLFGGGGGTLFYSTISNLSVEVVVDGGANDLLSCFYDFDEFVLKIYGFVSNIGGDGGWMGFVKCFCVIGWTGASFIIGVGSIISCFLSLFYVNSGWLLTGCGIFFMCGGGGGFLKWCFVGGFGT